SAALPKGMVVITADVLDELTIEIVKDADLPTGWNAPVAPKETKDLGTRWASSQRTAILSVPSAIVPQERNLLLSPLHPDFSKIKFKPPKPFVFDPRLK